MKGKRAFICHSHKDSKFILEVIKNMKLSFDEGIFYYEESQRSDSSFTATVYRELMMCGITIFFSGKEFSNWQKTEADIVIRHINGYVENGSELKRKCLHVLLSDRAKLPDELELIGGYPILMAKENDKGEALRIAKEIVLTLDLKWNFTDDLPINPHLFSYEKDIIDFFIKKYRSKGNKILIKKSRKAVQMIGLKSFILKKINLKMNTKKVSH